MFSCVCCSLCATQDEVPDANGVEFDSAIMEACVVELVERLSEKGVSSNGGEEIQCFAKCSNVQFFLECCKAVGVKCHFNRQHSL